jgi:hypothetical protein
MSICSFATLRRSREIEARDQENAPTPLTTGNINEANATLTQR